MGSLFRQLRTRLIAGSLLFLLGLTGAVILVVRDSLLFSARNMTQAGTQAVVEQRRTSLLEIVQREAELSDHSIHHNPADLMPLEQRLRSLNLMFDGFAFVVNESGNLVAASSNKIQMLTGHDVKIEQLAWQGISLLESDNPGLREVILKMQRGESGTSQIDFDSESVLIAFAPLEQTDWSFAIVEPVADIAASAKSLSKQVQSEVGGILRATLITIGYFAVIAIIGAVLAARALTGPIQTLVQGTRSITAGQLNVRIPIKTSDELGVLAESFNQMADELSRRKDETERMNASLLKSEERFRLAIEAAPNTMVMVNEAGIIVLANRQAEVLFGYRQDELIGTRVEMLLPERFYETHAHLRDQFVEEPQVHQLEAMRSMLGRRKDGSEFPAEVMYNPIETEEGLYILGSIVDISERQQLAEARIQAAVEERQRLARELHDSVTQSLYSLTLLAEASRRTAQAGELHKVIDNIARLGETAQQALKEMRLLVYELRPLALEQAGLADALQHRLDAVEKRAGVNAQLRVKLDVELPAQVENALYRIAQEALNNSLKHAEATRVFVSLRSSGKQVEMEIADNGMGFAVDATRDEAGLGLVSIGERVEALGGTWSISSRPGEGTQILIHVTLNDLD